MTLRRTMIAAAATALLALPPLAAQAQAQDNQNDDTQMLISRIQTDKRAVVLQSLGLTDEEVRIFTPIYDDYQRDRKKLYERSVDLLNKYASTYDSMTDAAAADILKEWFKIKRDEQDLLRSTAKRLGKIPTAKVLRFVQVESRLSLLLEAQAARIVPLAK